MEKSHFDAAGFTDEEKLLVYLLLYTGLRRQEVIPLSVFDINFNSGKISVNKAVKFVGEKAVLKDTKSYSGEREVYILEPIAPLLKSHISKLRSVLLFPAADGSSYQNLIPAFLGT